MRVNALILMVGCVLLLSGCANLNPLPKESKQLQQDAIARWKNCLNRHAGIPESTEIRDLSIELRSRCEGHRRDVLMSFPATVEPQLNTLLMEHTVRSAFSLSNDETQGTPATLHNLPTSIVIQSAR